jgi:hypothetical protein
MLTSKGHPSLNCHAEKDFAEQDLRREDEMPNVACFAAFFRVLLLHFEGFFQNDSAPG